MKEIKEEKLNEVQGGAINKVEAKPADSDFDKILVNGQIIIIKNGVKYNAAGQVIHNPSPSRNGNNGNNSTQPNTI